MDSPQAPQKWPLRVTTARSGRILVLSLAGRLGRASAETLSKAFAEVIDQPNRLVVMDLQSVDYVSSTGMAAMTDALAKARAKGVDVVVSGLTEPVRVALDLGGVLPELVVEPTREAAVQRLERTTGT